MSHVRFGVQEFEYSPGVGLGTYELKVALGFRKFNLELYTGQT